MDSDTRACSQQLQRGVRCREVNSPQALDTCRTFKASFSVANSSLRLFTPSLSASSFPFCREDSHAHQSAV